MALPTSRERTYAANSQVFSADLNALQDCVINGRRGPFVRNRVPRFTFDGGGTWAYDFASNVTYMKSTATGGSPAIIPLDVEQGDTLQSIVISAFGDGSVDVIYVVRVVSADMTTVDNITSGGSLTDSNRAAAWGNLTITLTADRLIAAGEVAFLSAQGSAANARIGNIRTTGVRL